MERRLVTGLLSLFGGGTAASEPATQASQPQRSKLFKSARAILAIPPERDAWDDYIAQDEHLAEFIWDGDGDGIARWNAQHGLDAGGSDVDWEFIGKDGARPDCFLTYRERTLQAPIEHDRTDNTVMILTLNRLVRADAEIRFCIDSWHNGTLGFFALPPAEWRMLEGQYGYKAVAYRFMQLPDRAEAFWREFGLEAEKAKRRPYNKT